MAKRRTPDPATEPASDARRRERALDARSDRSRVARLGTDNEAAPPPLSRAEQYRLRQREVIAQDAVQRMAVELRSARAEQHRADAARAEATVALARLHERYAEALDRLGRAGDRITALEAQNASLRRQLGREAAHV